MPSAAYCRALCLNHMPTEAEVMAKVRLAVKNRPPVTPELQAKARQRQHEILTSKLRIEAYTRRKALKKPRKRGK